MAYCSRCRGHIIWLQPYPLEPREETMALDFVPTIHGTVAIVGGQYVVADDVCEEMRLLDMPLYTFHLNTCPHR